MKKNLFFKLAFIILVFIIFEMVFIKNVHAMEIEDINSILDGNTEMSGKIMEYDAITGETKEVNIEEIRKIIKSKSITGEKNLKKLNAIPPISQKSREKYQPFAFWPPSGYVTMKTENTSLFPYNATCKVSASKRNGEAMDGSAAIVANNLALTSAHCVWDKDDNNYQLLHWQVHPGLNGQYYSADVCGWVKVYFMDNWKINHTAEDDWALCVLGDNVGEKVGCYGAASFEDNDMKNMGVTSIGYPKDKGGREQWQAYGSIDRVNTGYFRMTNLVTKGYSGGPIIRNGSNEEIVGVVHGYDNMGFGFGTRITDYMIEIIASYR